MTTDELIAAGWEFTTRRRKSDGSVRVRAVHKEHGLDITLWAGDRTVTEEAVRDAMVRSHIAPTHELLVGAHAA